MAFIHPVSPLPASGHLDPANAALALPRLEAELTELWGHINAATYRFLELLAEFDRREGWAAHGLASSAQWLNWQCGIGELAAREKVRVARALEDLPTVSAAFARGELSYSKVRALTRVATPGNEALLLDIALHGTAAHVERLVRKYRRAQQAEDSARAQGQHRARQLHCYYDDDGCMVLHARLPAEVGAVVRLAIERALDELAEEAPTSAVQPVGSVGPIERAAASAHGASLADMESGSEIQTHSNVSAETLSASPGSGVARGFAIRTQSNVSAETCGDPSHESMAARRADALRLMAERFLATATTATGSTADRYQVVVHVDQRSVAGVRRGTGRPGAPSASIPQSELHDTDSGVAAVTAELDDGAALALETVRRLACDASLVGLVETAQGEPLNVGRRTRSIPPALRRALAARDGGCRFPGCTHTRHTEGHHVVHWARGGETKLANLVTLCGLHHRLVHEGGFGVHVVHDGPERDMFVFTRPDGTRVPAVGPDMNEGKNEGMYDGLEAGPTNGMRQGVTSTLNPALQRQPQVGAGTAWLRTRHRARGLAIDASTARSRWRGEPLDYGLALDALCFAASDAGMRVRDLTGPAAPSTRL